MNKQYVNTWKYSMKTVILQLAHTKKQKNEWCQLNKTINYVYSSKLLFQNSWNRQVLVGEPDIWPVQIWVGPITVTNLFIHF